MKETNIPQKHLHSRISYLFQAAAYLTAVEQIPDSENVRLQPNASSGQVSLDEGILMHDAKVYEDTLGSTLSEKSLPVAGQSTAISRSSGLSYHLIGHLRSVSMKGQIRLSPTIKQSLCNHCHAFLVPGSTMSVHVENKSRGGKKPWTDVLVKTCDSCKTSKRFPIGAKRQKRRKDREREMSPSRLSDPIPAAKTVL